VKPYRVLIVEAHPFQLEYVLKVFNEVGDFSVDTVRDGVAALECLALHAYDLLLCDLLMPIMDGVQLIQKLAALQQPPALALISAAPRRMLVSAELAAKNLGLSVLGLIAKPVETDALRHLKARLAVARRNAESACVHTLGGREN